MIYILPNFYHILQMHAVEKHRFLSTWETELVQLFK